MLNVSCTHAELYAAVQTVSHGVSGRSTQPVQNNIYLARELTDNSLARIGHFFGGRDHSTVLHSYNKVADAIEDEEQVLWLINDLKGAFE